jgi:zinc protease
LPSYLGNNILGQFGLMGRIGESVRTKSGLAYHASSSVNAWADAGSWEFTAGLNPENLDKAIGLIQDEIKRFISEPVTAEELDDSQSNMIGRLPLSLESNAGIASAILTIERFNLGLDYYQHYAEKIRSISPQLILETAQKYLEPQKLVIASAGSGEDIP